MAEPCGCKGIGDFLEETQEEAGVVFCPKHDAVDDLIAALEECEKHIVALTSLGPGDTNIDAARASAVVAQDAIRKAQG